MADRKDNTERAKSIVEKLWGSKGIGLNVDERSLLEDMVEYYLFRKKFPSFAMPNKREVENYSRLIDKKIIIDSGFPKGNHAITFTNHEEQGIQNAVEVEGMAKGGQVKNWITANSDKVAYPKLKTPDGKIWERHSEYKTRGEAESEMDRLKSGFYEDAKILDLFDGTNQRIYIYVTGRDESFVDNEPVYVIRVIENGHPVTLNNFSEKERDETFEDIKKRGLKIISVKSVPFQEWKSKNKMASGGEVENKGIDLFEDYENIPSKVQKILDKYEKGFEDGDYKKLADAKYELESIGYTFEYYLDGVAYDLRKIGEMGKVEYAEKHHIGLMAKGGTFKVNKKYTHFAVSKATGKIVNGWETISDVDSLKYYAKTDLEDMDLKPSDYKILSAPALKQRGIDPFDWASWENLGQTKISDTDSGSMATGGDVGTATCKTCKWWNEGRPTKNIISECDFIKTITGEKFEKTKKAFYVTADASDDSGLHYELMTGEDFGCVHHTAFDDKNKMGKGGAVNKSSDNINWLITG